jgi:hypothetical protein
VFARLYSWWSRLYDLYQRVTPEDSDRGSTTENVIWIAFLAALALTVIGIFGPKILDAAKSVVFQ